ncbi:hypothetical protein D915_007195 [Fasciola hepatica]|uniref:Uncharacterized protein n=1 Tax=Fasciola hepatica TaxID=6192 RepID=A0A4E0R3M6_FASHE|nr:hypothetical protein D915_007195 [Fasciola hepatica]
MTDMLPTVIVSLSELEESLTNPWFYAIVLAMTIFVLFVVRAVIKVRAPFAEIERRKCFLYNGAAPNIVEAHHKCYSTKSNYGLHSVLIATDLDKAIQVLPASNSTIKYAWTGINDYLLEQNGSRIGWRAVNAELKDVVIEEKDDKWVDGEPTHGGTLMLQTDGNSYKLHTSYSFARQSEIHVIFQLVHEATVKPHSE